MPGRHRNAKDIWETLHAKKGPDLVRALSEELDSLHQSFADLEVLVRQIHARQALSENLFLLDEPPDLSAVLPKAIDLVASNLLEPRDGFYWLEQTNDGVPFRWTGPQRHFSFSVNIDRANPVIAQLEVISLVDDSQRYLDLYVDGVALPFRLEPVAGRYKGEASLPASPTGTTTKLTFVLPATSRARSAGPDTRELGVAFSKLTLRPADHKPQIGTNGLGLAEAHAETRRPGRVGGQVELIPQHTDANAAVTSPTVSQVFSFTAGHIRDGHPGFFNLEFEENGNPFRWSGGQSSFSFSIPIDRQSPLELQLKAIAVVDAARQSAIKIEVDGTEFSTELCKVADDHLEGRLNIPANPGAGPMLLTFTIPVLLKPKGNDTRKLGIAFSGLHLRPISITSGDSVEQVVPPEEDGLQGDLGWSHTDSPSALVEE